jgi:dihydroflavonol-4-reductase
MLEAARAAGVQKVIYTSSTGAVGLDSTPEQPLTEADWTQHSTLPYIRAKTEAEHAVWDFAARHRLNVVAIQPGMILGPYFYRETPSTWIIASILRRKFPAAPPFGAGFVDVRDAARAELLAYENPAASGRYLTVNGPFVSMADVMRLVHEIDPTVRVNTKQLPGWAMQVGVFLDWLGYRLLGRPRELPRAMLDEFVGRYVCYSHAKASRELGWEPMDFKTSVRDTMDWLRKNLAQKRL